MKPIHTYLLLMLALAWQCALPQAPGLVARFTFNDKKDYDEISGRKARLVGVWFREDRFGNANHAAFLFGNEGSYINLGNYPALKQRAATIIVWMCMESDAWSGRGYNVNPVILTKRSNEDDFFESYAIAYDLRTQRINTGLSRDSLKQITIGSRKPIEFLKWYQIAVSYDDHYVSFYVNGVLEGRQVKNFATVFQATDSVIIGASANKKNKRFLRACVDDLEFYNRVLSDQEIMELYKAPDPNRNKVLLNWFYLGMLILVCIFTLYHIIKYRLSLTMKKERQALELSNKLLANELRINRALMNPHFIFNSLNTLHNYILKHHSDKASAYLIKFSKLIRKILESNMSDIISLELEVELISGYLEMESLRFNEQIQYTITIDPAIVPLYTYIPIMMVQPFIENSVWHGLREKSGDKIIEVRFSLFEEKYIRCIIEDNGTGRKQKKDPLEKKSLATAFIQQRLDLLNKIYNLKADMSITDKPGGTGTVVIILLPILNKEHEHTLAGYTN